MRRIILIFALYLLSFPGLSSEVIGPMPKLEADKIDLGSVLPETILEQTLIVHNIGDSDLFLSKVQATCKCIEPLDFDKTIAHGKEGAVKISINVGRTIGSKQVFVKVGTNCEKKVISMDY